jgi:hypothetical protein
MRSTPARLVTSATLALTLAACATGGTIVSVTIIGGARTLAQGTAITLEVDVLTTGSATRAVTWSSSNPVVATISPDGTLHALTPGTATVTATSTADPSKSDGITIAVNPPGTAVWTRQFGTSHSDLLHGITTDADGNVYASGYTFGALDGTNAGNGDAFIRSYDGNGTHRWTRQFGTSSDDVMYGIAADANGNVYATGYTFGALEGANAGNIDAFIRSYDGNGTHRWTRQFGTSNSDIANGIATDANGNVYATGYTNGALEGANAGSNDAFIRSYDSNGTHRWTRQFGSSNSDIAHGVATDADGNVYATGYSAGALEGTNAGGADAFIISYDGTGTHRWTRQFGTSDTELALGITTDANGNVYATGYTDGALEGASAGGTDAFVRTYDSDGTLRWTRQFGTSSGEIARGITSDSKGNVYATGETHGALEGSNAGDSDAFIRSYDSDGTLRWTRQFGTSSSDYPSVVTSDAIGDVYTAGYTFGALAGTNAGSLDAFIRKYSP